MKARTGTSFGFLALRTVTAETVKRRFLDLLRNARAGTVDGTDRSDHG